jgi:hypothetical protein
MPTVMFILYPADIGVEDMIILKMELEATGWENVDWIDLAEVTDRWRDLLTR